MKNKFIAALCGLLICIGPFFSPAAAPLRAAEQGASEAWIAEALHYAETQQGVDQDGLYGAQCVDLVFWYAASIFNLNYYGDAVWGNANEMHECYNPLYFERIAYSPEAVQVGDVLVYAYGPGAGAGGHVAVVSAVYPGGFTVVNQHVNGREYLQVDDCPDALLWGYGIADYILRPLARAEAPASGGAAAPKALAMPEQGAQAARVKGANNYLY